MPVYVIKLIGVGANACQQINQNKMLTHSMHISGLCLIGTQMALRYDKALHECASMGGTLITVKSEDDSARLQQFLSKQMGFVHTWIGLRRAVWEWSTGKTFSVLTNLFSGCF